jgi:radical SAM superfamily enzyme YgiQ (UPF0313 family)
VAILFSNTSYQARVEFTSLISVVPPLDLAYCAALVRERLPEMAVAILDANVLGLPEPEHTARVRLARPDILVLTAATHSINRAGRLAAAVRDAVGLIVLVGTHGSALPEQTLREFPAIDVVVRGEPEEAVAEIAAARQADTPLDEIAGIHLRRADDVLATADRPLATDLDALPFPARDLLDNDAYSSPYATRVTALQTTRGCPGRCSFCDSHLLFGRRVRTRTPARVVDEMAECIDRYGTNYFAILDHTFTASRAFVLDVCREIFDRGLQRKMRWVCNTRVDMLDDPTVQQMRRAGCLQVGIGIESAVDARLAAVDKGVSEAQIDAAVARLKRHGIIAMGYAIIGFPDDDEARIAQTRRKLFELDPHTLQLSFATPLPGSRLRKQCVAEKRLLSDNWDDYVFLNKPILRGDHLDPATLTARRNAIVRDFYFRPAKLTGLVWFFAARARVNLFAAATAAWKIARNLRRARQAR